MKTVIGLVGLPASGKSTAVFDLVKKGFKSVCLSDPLVEIASVLSLNPDRETLFKIGCGLREKFGDDILAKSVINLIKETGENKIVIDSVRSPEEVKLLQAEVGAFIIGISMPQETRFQMIKTRNKPGDPTTWEEFMELTSREEAENSRVKTIECMKLANVIIENDGYTPLLSKIDEVLITSKLIEGNVRGKERY